MKPTEKIRFEFNIEIDDPAKWMKASADCYRLWELVKATIEVHAHKGFHVTSSAYEAK